MSALLLVLSLVLYLLLAVIFTLRFFKSVTLPRWVIAFFLCTVAVNILVAELLHFLRALDKTILFILLQFMLCVLIGILLWDPKHRIFPEPMPRFKVSLGKRKVGEIILSALIFLVLAGFLVPGWMSPINNSDSLHTHLPRVYYWLQHGSLESWYAVTDTQITYPINASLQGLWLFLLGGSEKLFFLVQWFSLVCVAALVHEIACLLGANSRQSLVAVLVTLSMPVILLQTGSFQGDLFIAALLLAAVYYLLQFLIEKNDDGQYLSALALALGLGAKQTAFLFLPVFLLVILILFIRKRLAWRNAWRWLFILLACFIAFSSLKFVQNTLEQKVGTSSMLSSTIVTNPGVAVEGGVRTYPVNTLRYLYQSVSLDGLTGSLKLNALEMKQDVFRVMSAWLGLDLEASQYLAAGESTPFSYTNPPPMNEDAAWFGPLMGLLSLPVIVVVLLGKEKNRKWYLGGALVVAVWFFASLVIFKGGWGPSRGRYLIFPAVLFAPLVFTLVPRGKWSSVLVTALLAIASVYLAFSTLLMNDSRPLWTTRSLTAFQANTVNQIEVTNFLNSQYRQRLHDISGDLMLTSPDRVDIGHCTYYEKLFFQSAREIRDIEFINALVPDQQTLYLHTEKTLLEYALFGINRARELYPIANFADVPVGNYVLVSNSLLPADTSGFKLVDVNDDYALLIRQ